jgi:hypothetical protein
MTAVRERRGELRAASGGPRVTSGGPRATSGGPRATSGGPRAASHGSRAAGHGSRAAGRERRATGHEPRATGHGPRAANPGRRVPFWQFSRPRLPTASGAGVWLFAFQSAIRTPQSAMLLPVPPACLPPQLTNDKGRMTVVPHSALVTPFPALLYGHGCPQVFGAPSPGAYSVSFDSAKSFPQRRMDIRPCKKPSNPVKNRQNGVKIGSKRGKKGAHFVMPILTFWGVTPSGASARADLACRRG